MIQIDMPMPENCYDCLFKTEPCGCCVAAEMVYGETFDSGTIPYCNKRHLGKPDWCPLKEVVPCVGDQPVDTPVYPG